MDDFRIIGQSSKLLLRIAHDGAIELGPDIQSEEAKEVATALSTYVQDLKATIARYEAVRAALVDLLEAQQGAPIDRMMAMQLVGTEPWDFYEWSVKTHAAYDALDAYREAVARLDRAGEGT